MTEDELWALIPLTLIAHGASDPEAEIYFSWFGNNWCEEYGVQMTLDSL